MRIVIRTEGNHQQGMGDVWSSIALADECIKGSDEIRFIVSHGHEAVNVIKACGYEVFTVDSVVKEQDILHDFRPDIIIVNKLNNPLGYIRYLKELTRLVVTVDDAGEEAKYADLNFNVLYPISGAVTDLQYIALRDEFQQVPGETKAIRSEVRELLLTQGGSDTYGFTPRIIRALEGLTCRPHCTVVIGPAFYHEMELEEATHSSTLDLSIVRNTHDMAQLMWNADLAITAGGLTMFELACAGTPSLVVCGEPFEVETAGRLEKAGAVVSLGFGGVLDYAQVPVALEALAADTNKRRCMSLRGRQLIDGRGCERVVGMIRERVEALGTYTS